MKILSYFLLLLIISIANTASASEPTNKQPLLCMGNEATLECLKLNISALYQQDYKRHSDILNTAHKKAVECKDLKETANYIEIYTMQELPVETEEGLHEDIENLALSKPQCFLDAVLLLDQTKQKDIIDAISAPFLDAGVNTDKALAPFRNNPKYKTLLVPFFEARVKTK